jgi:hypothetical protein
MQQLSHWTNFHEIWNSSKICRGNSCLIKIWQVWRLLCTKTYLRLLYLCVFFLEKKKIFTKVSEEVTFYLQYFFFSEVSVFVCDCKKQNVSLHFHCNSCYENESQCDLLRTLPILFCAIWLQFPLISNQRLQMKLKSQSNNLNSRSLTHYLTCLNMLKYSIVSNRRPRTICIYRRTIQ